jgi:Mrp family chromosome partitioning ATPase
MTEQSKINPGGAPKRKGAASLFERADAAFGLDNLGPAAVPQNLPKIAQRVPPAPYPAAVQAAPPRDQIGDQLRYAQPAPVPHPEPDTITKPAPEPERAVTFSGKRQEIDRELLYEAGLIVPENPVTGLLEEFRIVKRELLADARAVDDPLARRILVSSPHPGEGKTYCAVNLAIALAAERDVEVLLIDADVLNPSITRQLGLEPDAGLMDAISDKTLRPEELVSPTDIDGLFVMQAGTGSALDSEYLTSARTAQVLDRLTRGAPNRFVIFDTPPALLASPAAELAAYVGQVLLVVRADQTGRAALDDARQLLSACPDIKLLLNATQFSPSGRRFGDYGEREE